MKAMMAILIIAILTILNGCANHVIKHYGVWIGTHSYICAKAHSYYYCEDHHEYDLIYCDCCRILHHHNTCH